MVEFVFLGDSLTYGYPYGPNASWTKIVTDKLGVSFLNLGVCGDTLADMKERFKRERILGNTLVLLGGTNDIYVNRPTSEILQDAREIITEAKERNFSAIVLATPLPVLEEEWADERLKILGRKYREIAGELGVKYLDFYEPFKKLLNNNPGVLIDGLHPSREGYRIMAQIFLSFLGIENDF
ncbi:lipase/acylhydrolase [Carboxydothermus islandicus]|uniref:Lipase/acylhydrolase n=1 Tax=Carboxydothermus islandicus TaxID=661089 RepID=A0A1L8D001_9THEO|nr:SGNH/GDSL hydrolase family protein [Carboxydothermus islandicus]GAV24488.1 lipase/acylhydrolase [Carboxydothermus islandicus]